MKSFIEYLQDVEQERLDEDATSGATSAASIAIVVGGLGQKANTDTIGVGFEPDGHERSIYPAPKSPKTGKKPILRR
jgi:hypothetical protein